jgi:hypothetical protein
VTEGWVSTCYAQCAPAPIALFEAEGAGAQEFLTLIFPGAVDQIEAVERQILKRWSTVDDRGLRLASSRQAIASEWE